MKLTARRLTTFQHKKLSLALLGMHKHDLNFQINPDSGTKSSWQIWTYQRLRSYFLASSAAVYVRPMVGKRADVDDGRRWHRPGRSTLDSRLRRACPVQRDADETTAIELTTSRKYFHSNVRWRLLRLVCISLEIRYGNRSVPKLAKLFDVGTYWNSF